jgi:hypothetical protein
MIREEYEGEKEGLMLSGDIDVMAFHACQI